MTNYTLTTVTGGLTLTPKNAHSIQGMAVSDNMRMNYSQPTYAFAIALTAGVGIASSLTPARGIMVNEGLGLNEAAAPALRYSQALTELATLQDTLLAGRIIQLADGVGIHETLAVFRAAFVQEVLALAHTQAAATKYGMALTETFKFHDALLRFVGGTLSEALGLAEAIATKWYRGGALSDGIGIHENVAPVLLIGMEIDDSITLHHDEVLNAIFHGDLNEVLNLRALHVEPNGDIASWAINTRTSAVTEYKNYEFNSFAKFGNHYIGANDKGLFILDGPRDVIDNIPTNTKSGKMSTGSKFTTLHAAYLGLSLAHDDAPQDFFLKMVAGDGREYIYAVKPAPDGVTTKVRMGKGLRSRYFSFELITTGADFDLDAIEFIPIVSKRRV